MKKKVIIGGDSYAYGHGCSDRIYYYDYDLKKYIGEFFRYPDHPPSEFGWASLAQKDFPEYEFINISRPGNANQGIFANIVDYFNYHKELLFQTELIIFAGTFVDRVEIADMQFPLKAVPWVMQWDPPNVEHPEYYIQAKEGYRKYLYNGEIGLHQTLSAVMGMHSFAQSRNIKYAWSLPDYSIPYEIKGLYDGINPLKFKHIHHFDYSGNKDEDFNKTCLAPDTHLNNLGHKQYYELEVKPKLTQLLR